MRVVEESDADENDVDEDVNEDVDEDVVDENDVDKDVVVGCDMVETIPPPAKPAEGAGGKEEKAAAAFVLFDDVVKREARVFSKKSRVTILSRKKCTTDFRL